MACATRMLPAASRTHMCGLHIRSHQRHSACGSPVTPFWHFRRAECSSQTCSRVVRCWTNVFPPQWSRYPTRFLTRPPACYGASWQLPGPNSHPAGDDELQAKTRPLDDHLSGRTGWGTSRRRERSTSLRWLRSRTCLRPHRRRTEPTLQDRRPGGALPRRPDRRRRRSTPFACSRRGTRAPARSPARGPQPVQPASCR